MSDRLVKEGSQQLIKRELSRSNNNEYEEDTSLASDDQSESMGLVAPSILYDEYILNNAVSISPRDKLEFVNDAKQAKETSKYLRNNANLNKLTRMIQTEVIRCKPNNILDFINDEFFSLENQTRLRNIIHDWKSQSFNHNIHLSK